MTPQERILTFDSLMDALIHSETLEIENHKLVVSKFIRVIKILLCF